MSERKDTRRKIDRMTKRLVDSGMSYENAKTKSIKAAIRQEKKSK